MTTTFVEQVRSLRATVGSIRTIVGNHHVGESDASIAENWRARAIKAKCTPYQTRRIIQIALACHHDNQGLYHAVMTGKL